MKNIISEYWGQFPIESEQLYLRPPVITDASAMLGAKRETWADLQKWMLWAQGDMPSDVTLDEKMIIDQNGEHARGEDCMLIGFEKSTGQAVVFTGLHRPDWDKRIFEIGYWVRSSAHGKGFAQEVTNTLTSCAFNRLNASKVLIATAEENKASLHIIKKCGFHFTHIVPRHEDEMGQETIWFEKLRP